MNARALPSLAGVHLAASTGDHEQLEKLIQSGSTDVNDLHESGLYPLHFAVKGGHVRCVELLASRSTPVQINILCDAYPPMSALHMAAMSKKESAVEMVMCLLSYGADVNVRCFDENVVGETPLHLASYGASVKLVEMLLAHGAMFTRAESIDPFKSESAIFGLPQLYAVRGGNLPALCALIDFEQWRGGGIAPNSEEASDILQACAQRREMKFNLPTLMKAIDAYGEAAIRHDGGDAVLATLISSSDLEGFRFALEGGFRPLSVDNNGHIRRKALNAALASPLLDRLLPLMQPFVSADIVSELNDQVPDADHPVVEANGNHPVIAAMSYGHIRYLEAALGFGFTPNPPLTVTEKYYATLPENRSWFHTFRRMYNCHTTIGYYIAFCLRVPDTTFLEQSVALLLSSGANANAVGREIPPLLALMMSESEPLRYGTRAWNVAELIIQAGVHWGHRSSGSTFRSPDLAPFAAVTANTNILKLVFANTTLGPLKLLADLKDFQVISFQISSQVGRYHLNIGWAIIHMISTCKISSASVAAINLCTQLDRRFGAWWSYDGTHLRKEASEIWRLIHNIMHGEHSLKHACRAVVVSHLKLLRHDVGRANGVAAVVEIGEDNVDGGRNTLENGMAVGEIGKYDAAGVRNKQENGMAAGEIGEYDVAGGRSTAGVVAVQIGQNSSSGHVDAQKVVRLVVTANSITAAIDQLPLPDILKQYLKCIE